MNNEVPDSCQKAKCHKIGPVCQLELRVGPVGGVSMIHELRLHKALDSRCDNIYTIQLSIACYKLKRTYQPVEKRFLCYCTHYGSNLGIFAVCKAHLPLPYRLLGKNSGCKKTPNIRGFHEKVSSKHAFQRADQKQ